MTGTTTPPNPKALSGRLDEALRGHDLRSVPFLGAHALRRTYADRAYAKQVARAEFPQLPGEVIDSAIDTELQYRIPSQSVVVDPTQWSNLMTMQKYLGNIQGTTSFAQIVDNDFASKAAAA